MHAARRHHRHDKEQDQHHRRDAADTKRLKPFTTAHFGVGSWIERANNTTNPLQIDPFIYGNLSLGKSSNVSQHTAGVYPRGNATVRPNLA